MCLYKIAAQVPGDLDTLYGADGNFCFPLDPASEFMPQNPDDEGSFQSAYEMDDGNIILGGMQGGNFMAMKITPQGRMIYGFGENGVADLSAVPYLGQLTSDGFKKIRQLPDGRFTGSTPRIVMITSEGVLDSTYHEDGIFDPPGIGYPECYDILDDNRIVFSYMYQNQINLILVRADGEPDSTFSLDGRQTIPVGIQTSIASVHFTNDQGIIFTSTTSEGCCINNYSMQIRKVTLIGSPFPGFGSLGVVTRGDASHHYQLQSSILDDQNRLIVGGVFSANAQTNPKVWFSRYLSDGTLDMTFGVNGDLIFTFPNAVVGPYATIDDMQWLPNGNILVTTDNGAFKITADGEWIESWGINGIHNYTYGSIVPMDDSRTLICSQYDNRPGVYAEIDMNNEFYYDLGFGSDGMCTFNSFRNMTLDLPYKYMKSDGGVIGIGGAYDSDIHTPDNFYRVVAASNSAGVQDTMFGTHGYYFMDVNEIVDIVAEQSDGRLILGGEFFGFDGSYLFRRLNADGSIDTSFGDGTGNAALWIDDDANYIIKDIHMLENDDFLVLLFWNDDNISILKFLSDGTPDLSFGDNGWVEIYLNMWYQENSNVPMYLKTDEYDRIILGGDLPLSSGQNAAYIIQRYLPNGEADFSFGQFGHIYEYSRPLHRFCFTAGR
ncbi:MAG: delta-60 repeat domain-containing protein [Flavobacteriales bacterium]|nr:delta-60 repeat domain-containing protein [Flavobacteriales bacterium]